MTPLLRSASPASSSGRFPASPPTASSRPSSARRGARVALACVAAAGAGGPGAGGGSGFPGRKARKHRLFEIVDASPPPRSLGEHPLPPDTHNGDRIELPDGRAWLVQRTSLHYRLVRGRYVRSAARVDVVSAGRFLVERYLDGLMELPAEGGGGGSGGGGGGGSGGGGRRGW